MHIEIDRYGGIHKLNDQDQHHSFDGKPAVIRRDGHLSWFEHGRLVKTQFSSGFVLVHKH